MGKLAQMTIAAIVTELRREKQWKSQEEPEEFTQVTLRGEGQGWLQMRWPTDCDEPIIGDEFTITIEEIL